MNRLSSTSLLSLLSLLFALLGCTPNSASENQVANLPETRSTPIPTIELVTPLPSPQIEETAQGVSPTPEIQTPAPTETPELYEPIAQIGAAWEPALVNQIGGDQRILAQQDNFLYVGVGTFLQVFDISDATRPTLIHMQKANDGRESYIGSMVIHDLYAILTIHGFHPGTGFMLMVDLSNPRAPVVIPNEDPPHSLYVVGKNEILIQVTGFVKTEISLHQLVNGEVTPLPAEHPFRQRLFTQAAAQITQDSENAVSPTLDEVAKHIGDAEIRGDLLVLTWEDFPCLARDTSSEVVCHAGILLFDISDLQFPTLIHAITLDEEQWIHGLTNAGILTHHGRQSRITQQIDLKPFLPNPEILPLDMPDFNQIDSLTDVHPKSIASYGDIGYIIGEDQIISIVDLSQLPSISRINQISLPTAPSEMNISYGFLTINSKDRVDVYDLRSPVQPTLIYTREESGMTYAINTANFLVYGLDNKLKLIPNERLTDPQSSAPLTEILLEGEVEGVWGVNEPYIYILVDHPILNRISTVIDSTNLELLDAPFNLSDFRGGEVIDLAPYPQLGVFQDGLFFANCDFKRICIFDVATRPDHPTLLGHTTQCHIHIQGSDTQVVPIWHQVEEILELPRPISAADLLVYGRISHKLCFYPTMYAKPDIDSIINSGYWIRAEYHEGLSIYQSVTRE